MIKTVQYKGMDYPEFQAKGFAAKYAFPFASEVCRGKGYDIGCCKKEWSLPGSTPIDLSFNDDYHALNLPDGEVDYIFSSHCLEHVFDWVKVLDYWTEKIKCNGVLFLYLPHPKQEYWLPFNNRKHIHSLSPQIIEKYLFSRHFINIFVTEFDLNYSFYAMAQVSEKTKQINYE